MPTIFRAHGLRFVIYLDDHDPAHVHIIGSGEAKIAMEPNVRLLWQKGFSKNDVQKAFDVVIEHRTGFLEHWEAIHGKID